MLLTAGPTVWEALIAQARAFDGRSVFPRNFIFDEHFIESVLISLGVQPSKLLQDPSTYRRFYQRHPSIVEA